MTVMAWCARFPDDATAAQGCVQTRGPQGLHCAHGARDDVSTTPRHPPCPFMAEPVAHSAGSGRGRSGTVRVEALGRGPSPCICGLRGPKACPVGHGARIGRHPENRLVHGPAEPLGLDPQPPAPARPGRSRGNLHMGGKAPNRHRTRQSAWGRGTGGPIPLRGLTARPTRPSRL